MTAYLEIIFPQAADPGDVEILTPASYARPGRARIKKATVEQSGRVLSHNGGALIGYVATGQPLTPFIETYWLTEEGAPADATH